MIEPETGMRKVPPEAAVRVAPRSGACGRSTAVEAGRVSSRGSGCEAEGGGGVGVPLPGSVTGSPARAAPGGMVRTWPSRTVMFSGRALARARASTVTP